MKYVLADVQGSGRALMNNSGSGTSTIVSRHDYLPFGEEIWAGVGLRTTTQKYATTDKVRQRFALTERDEATGLDHTWFRKYESFAGRWTTPDPLAGNLSNPQNFNRYAYVNNDPVNFVDPSGLLPCNPGDRDIWCTWGDTSRGFWGQGNLIDRPRHDGRTIIQSAEVAMWLRVEVARGGFIWFNLIPQQDPERKDCHDFAGIVDRIAQKNPNQSAVEFRDALMARFSRVTNEFDSAGFKREFKDPDGSPDQARHYVGGLFAGFLGHAITDIKDFGDFGGEHASRN